MINRFAHWLIRLSIRKRIQNRFSNDSRLTEMVGIVNSIPDNCLTELHETLKIVNNCHINIVADVLIQCQYIAKKHNK